MKFDIALKDLFQQLPTALLQHLTGSHVVEILNIEYPTVKTRRPDLVARLENKTLSFQYTLLDMRSIDSNLLLKSEQLADHLLAILGSISTPQTTIREVLSKLTSLDENSRRDALEKLSILVELRNKEFQFLFKQEKNVMPITIDLMDSLWAQEAFNKGKFQGKLEGKLEGKVEGERLILKRLLERRFNTLPEWVLQYLNQATDKQLEMWIERLFDVNSLEELFSK